MPLYFAYGSNMDVDAMRTRCPRSKPLCAGRLPRHRFLIMQGGYGSIARDPRRSVHGVLWDLALADVRALDAYEDVAGGLYTKVEQPILRATGGSARALVYIGRTAAAGEPRPAYIEQVIAAARAWALPEPYLRELAAFQQPAMTAAMTAAKTSVKTSVKTWTAPDGSAQGLSTPARADRPKVRPRFATPLDRR